MATEADGPPQLGLRANLAQFSLLVAVNALVGGMLGQERIVLPLLADQTFHLAAYTSALTFILAFGVVKADHQLLRRHLVRPLRPQTGAGGRVADRAASPVNADLGAELGLGHRRERAARHQPGPDLVSHRDHEDRPGRSGAARPGDGVNEAAGYVAVAVTAMATGYLAEWYGLRPAPFLLGAAYAALGLGLSTLAVRETRGHVHYEASSLQSRNGQPGNLSTRRVSL